MDNVVRFPGQPDLDPLNQAIDFLERHPAGTFKSVVLLVETDAGTVRSSVCVFDPAYTPERLVGQLEFAKSSVIAKSRSNIA